MIVVRDLSAARQQAGKAAAAKPAPAKPAASAGARGKKLPLIDIEPASPAFIAKTGHSPIRTTTCGNSSKPSRAA